MQTWVKIIWKQRKALSTYRNPFPVLVHARILCAFFEHQLITSPTERQRKERWELVIPTKAQEHLHCRPKCARKSASPEQICLTQAGHFIQVGWNVQKGREICSLCTLWYAANCCFLCCHIQSQVTLLQTWKHLFSVKQNWPTGPLPDPEQGWLVNISVMPVSPPH